MNIIDLSHLMYSEMPFYSGSEKPDFKTIHTIDSEGFRETKLTFYSHTGTHVDVPGHMIPEGLLLDTMKIGHFLGRATLVDVSRSPSQSITLEHLKGYQKKIRKVDFVVIKTGWSRYWGESKYDEQYPCLKEEAASWLSSFRLKGIGIDTISIDRTDSTEYPIHNRFLSKNCVIIENLTNLDRIKDEFFQFCCFPLKIKDVDGSPIRAVAMEGK